MSYKPDVCVSLREYGIAHLPERDLCDMFNIPSCVELYVYYIKTPVTQDICRHDYFVPGSGGVGLPETVYNAIMDCDIDTRRDFFPNIILAGGNTLFPGERLPDLVTVLVQAMPIKHKLDPMRWDLHWDFTRPEISMWISPRSKNLVFLIGMVSHFHATDFVTSYICVEFTFYPMRTPIYHRKCNICDVM